MDNIIFHINVFHESADDSIKWSLNIARAFNKRAFFLHIVDPRDEGWYPPHADSQSFVGDMTTEQLREKEKKMASDLLDKKLSKYLSMMNNPPVANVEAEIAMTDSKLIERSKEKETYIISIDRTSQRNAEDLYHQHHYFIKESECPVLLVRQPAPTSTLKNIVYLTNFKKQDIPVINSLKKISSDVAAKFQSYHVDPNQTFLDKVNQLRHEDKFVRSSIKEEAYTVKNIKKENMLEALQAITKNEKPDLIVVLKENRSFWEKIFEKNQVKHVIIESNIPVLIFHQKSKDFAKV